VWSAWVSDCGAVREGTYGRGLVDVAMNTRFLGLSIEPFQLEDELTEFMEYVREISFSTVLEIGAAQGGTLFLLCQMCPDDAVLISVDLPPEGRFGGGYERWK
jgi:hypothetical protein